MMRHQTVLAILGVLFLFAAASSTASARLGGGGALVGGWKPIEDLSDPEVKEIADFAVSEYNRRSHASLTLKKIVKGETQVVAGTNYRLLLAVANGKASQRYQAVVWDKPWLHFRNLTSFTPVS